MTIELWVAALVALVVTAPLLAAGVIALALFLLRAPPERFTARVTAAAQWAGLTGLFGLVVAFQRLGAPRAVVPLGAWFTVEHTSFEVALLVDPLALVFAGLTATVGGVVTVFAHRYVHRERGYHRLFLLLNLFLGGMFLVIFAATLEVTFAGWELLGLGSALLVGFFHEREAPVRNALRAFVVYRVGDAALMAAAIQLHHAQGGGGYEALLAGERAGGGATAIGLLFVLAVAGKCAQLPFSGWLPRAMEGPTPSTAVFYGALSVHAGAYLMLRVGPLVVADPVVRGALLALGLTTAAYATLVARAQTDVKSALAFASLTQVSLVLVEIALGLHALAVAHVLGHSFLRVLQYLRAPSVLLDAHRADAARGGAAVRPRRGLARWIGETAERRLYGLALARGHVDAWLDRVAVAPFLGLFRALDRLERGWTAALDRALGGGARLAPTSARAPSPPTPGEEPPRDG